MKLVGVSFHVSGTGHLNSYINNRVNIWINQVSQVKYNYGLLDDGTPTR